MLSKTKRPLITSGRLSWNGGDSSNLRGYAQRACSLIWIEYNAGYGKKYTIQRQSMNDEEWRNLHENFETTLLLDAVGHVDELRGYLNDGEYGRPPEIRDDLLKLHGMAMDVVNNG